MTKFKKSQLLMLSLIAALLFATPFLSTSLRSTYLYFITNILIIALGAEAGLLSAFPEPTDDKTQAAAIAPKPGVSIEASVNRGSQINTKNYIPNSESMGKKPKVPVEKSTSEKIVAAPKVHKVKKCPSTPSIFFIAGAESDANDPKVDHWKERREEQEQEEEQEVGGITGQELFAKAENFIGNFYKQLKMQKEESWNKIHGF
ncbi:hypothetical protein Ancab_004463 [Ancistrocladus abbreviatus]